MVNPKDIQIADYSYDLPDERIAKYPLAQRDQSKLLVYRHGEVSEDVFASLPAYLPQGALMVMNNTKVIQARLHFRKAANEQGQGALIEVFCLEPAAPSDYQVNFASRGKVQWYCLVGNLKKWKEGKLARTIEISQGSGLQPQSGTQAITLTAERVGTHGTSQVIEFQWDGDYTWAEILDAVGELPIPPYLNRQTEESDKRTYQTVYSKIKGSVAAPTAGLHFTEAVLAALDKAGIEREEVTLHVGAGTFKPVKSENIGGHDMHTEHIAVKKSTIERLIAHGGHAIAVGTTSVRTLESLYYMGLKAERLMAEGKDTGDGEELHVEQWEPYAEAAKAAEVSDAAHEATSAACGVSDAHPDVSAALSALIIYMSKHSLEVLQSSTQIIIAPGYRYHIVKMMVTNFHQPQSTLLLLVSAFLHGDWRKVYDYALTHDFRFLSYGDSSLLTAD